MKSRLLKQAVWGGKNNKNDVASSADKLSDTS
jgi:hypothetical protein